MSLTIAVGRSADPGRGATDLILLPHEEAPAERPGLTVLAPLDLTRALYLLRERYAGHKEIASLGGATVVGTADPAWTSAIEARLSEFLDDLGNCPVDSWTGALNAIRNGQRLASEHTAAGLFDALTGFPAICVGSGPSATPEALAHIGRLSKNHVIFAADSIAGACRKAGFVPHFVTMLERPPEMVDIVRGAGCRSAILLAPPVIDPACAAEFDRVCWFWAGDPLYRWLDPRLPIVSAGRSAGTLSVSAAIIAGCNPIFLVGHDLCYAPGASGAGHSGGAHPLAQESQVAADAAGGAHYHSRRLRVPGYCGTDVWSNGMWNLFRGDIETMVACNPGVEVFTAADHYLGAEIAGVARRDLPSCGRPDNLVPSRISLATSSVPDPTKRIPSIAADLKRLAEAAGLALVALSDEACPIDTLAEEMAVSRIVSAENAHLFHYLLRSIYSALSLRLHLHGASCADPAGLQRDCLGLLARTLLPLCAKLASDLAEIK